MSFKNRSNGLPVLPTFFHYCADILCDWQVPFDEWPDLISIQDCCMLVNSLEIVRGVDPGCAGLHTLLIACSLLDLPWSMYIEVYYRYIGT